MSVFLACGAIAVRVLLDEVLKGWIAGVVTAALNGTAWPPLNSLFLRLAENSALTPASAYVAKALAWLDIAVATLVAAMLVLALWVARPLWGETTRRFFRDVFRHAGPAAVILGMAVAIRTAGIFGGVLVVGYAWHRWRRRSAPFLLTYSLGAAVVAFALWPQLWGGPLDFLRSSVERSLQFPDGHEVLFRGEILVSNGLPSIFLPWLMAIQFTFPGVLLVLLALPMTVWIALRPAQPNAQLWVLLLWFFLPSLAVVILRLPIYNNFRHLLFIVPPLFVLGAVVLERFLQASRWTVWLFPILMLGMILPGVVGIVRLHPYEYIYYTALWAAYAVPLGGMSSTIGAQPTERRCTPSTKEPRRQPRWLSGGRSAPPSRFSVRTLR
jgi:hypothetical protein